MSDYFVDDDRILPNKLGIKDPDGLHKIEAEIVFLRNAEIHDEPIQGSFDMEYLQQIHKHLFSDIYDFAGHIRTVNLTKDESVFCYVENLAILPRKKSFDGLRKMTIFVD